MIGYRFIFCVFLPTLDFFRDTEGDKLFFIREKKMVKVVQGHRKEKN